MNKNLQIIGMVLIFLVTLTSVKADSSSHTLCTDTDNGLNVFEAGRTFDSKGHSSTDKCEGSSGKIKEYYCDSDNK